MGYRGKIQGATYRGKQEEYKRNTGEVQGKYRVNTGGKGKDRVKTGDIQEKYRVNTR